jgi:hypothetical protein
MFRRDSDSLFVVVVAAAEAEAVAVAAEALLAVAGRALPFVCLFSFELAAKDKI